MRWPPLAALSYSYASCLSATAAFAVVMPTASGVHRAFLGRKVCLTRAAATMALPLRIRVPPTRPAAARRVFQQRMMSSSTSEQQQQQQKAEASTSAAAKRRASSRYIPSDFRGVRGGPKGKWKARLVFKGQLKQLGTFESELDAALAYNEAARSLHGAAAKLNLLPDETPATASASASAPEEPVETAAAEKEKPLSSSAPAPAPEVAENLQTGRSADTTTPLGDAIEAHGKKEGEGGAGAAAADLCYLAELDFRDLEEIPESTGPPLWEDTQLESTWAAMSAPGTGGGRAAGAAANVDGKSSSVSSATTAPTEGGNGLIRDSVLVEDIGRTEQGDAGGVERGVLRGESEPRLGYGPPPKDESASAHTYPNTVAPTAAKMASRAAAVAGMASVGGEVEGVSGGRRQRRLSSTLASSQQADATTGTAAAAAALPRPPGTAAAAAAATTATSGTAAPAAVGADPSRLDLAPRLPPMPTPPPLVEAEQARSETVPGAAAAAGVDTVTFPTKEKLASTEEPLSEKSVQGLAANAAPEGGGSGESRRQGVGGVESAGGDGGGGGNWGQKGAWPGVVGTEWERDEMGDELYEERLNSVVDVSTGLDRYWMEPLMSLTKPETRKVAMQLTSDNKLGYRSQKGGPVSKGSLLQYVIEQKEKHPTKVLLTRVGEFYETYGVDAVMLMQHAGLNQMGQEVRAGCPRKNLQQTLNGLTSAGLTVAVYEEMNDVDAQRGPSARKSIKERALSQVVSPGSPNYLYDSCLRTDDISFRESKPYVGVMKDSSGYLLCQIFTDEREMQVSERMTEEAVRVAIEEAGVAEPVFDQGTGLAFLPDHTEQLTGFPSSAFPGQIISRVARLLELAESDLQHFRTVTRTPEGRPRAVYPSTASQIGLLKNDNVPDLVPCLLPRGYPAACHRFLRKWLLLPPSYHLADSAHKLCRQLASPDQAGLPPLHAVPVGKAKALLLDRQCNVPFFREIHKCMSGMLDMLEDGAAVTMPEGAFFPVAEEEAEEEEEEDDEDPDAVLTGGGGSGAGVEGGIAGGGAGRARGGGSGGGKYSELLPHLLDLVSYQSGVEAVEGHLRDRAKAVIRAIEAVIAAGNTLDTTTADPDGLVPEKFWLLNEAGFRGSLSLRHEPTKRVYDLLRRAASELCTAVKEDFPNAAQDLTFDYHNNGIYLTKLPASAKNTAASSSSSSGSSSSSSSSSKSTKRGKAKFAEVVDEGGQQDGADAGDKDGAAAAAAATPKKPNFVNPRDRFGKVLPKRFTTERVSAALAGYLAAVEETETRVRLELQALSDMLVANNDLPVIAQAAHWSVICQAMEGHVRRALSSGWSLPSLKDLDDPDMGMKVENLVPYWLPREEAVPNSFDFEGLFLLTAPNMSGKSTLMRAVLACSLLSNAGLFAPCTSAVVPRFDGFFLRTASFDIPAERKSAFALEMDDVRVMLRDSSRRSLALVDELGKGTSARDGAALAGALLEEMDRRCITGIFATHLHELFDLPLNTKTLSNKRMGINWEDEDGRKPRWTFVMEDGQCTDSLALQTAKKYNIPEEIMARAEELTAEFDEICRGGGRSSSSSSRCSSRSDSNDGRGGVGRADSDVSGGNGGANGDDAAWWPSEEGEGWGGGSSAGGFKSMGDAAQVMRRVTGRPDRDLIPVDSGYGTPPALEGQSCLYVLRYSSLLNLNCGDIGAAGHGDDEVTAAAATASPAISGEGARASSPASPLSAAGGEEEAGVWFYVGESDAIRERLTRHARRWGGSGGGAKAFKLDAVVVAVENRSEARRLETAVIRAMKEEGFYLVSDKDGSRTHFSSWK